MKSRKIIILLIIVNVVLVGIIYSFITRKDNIIIGKQIIKDMSETEYETQITQLNKSHEEYANTINEYKFKIAEAITNKGISTEITATADIVVENIEKILEVGTSDATATESDISSGKTAWVKGKLIIGSASNKSEPKVVSIPSNSSWILSQTVSIGTGYENVYIHISNAGLADGSASTWFNVTYDSSTGICTLTNPRGYFINVQGVIIAW